MTGKSKSTDSSRLPFRVRAPYRHRKGFMPMKLDFGPGDEEPYRFLDKPLIKFASLERISIILNDAHELREPHGFNER